MDSQQFDAIVSEMQALNDRSNDEYRKKVGRFTAFGFGVYLGAFALILLALATVIYLVVTVGFNGIALKVILVLSVLAFFFSRSMFIKIDPPEGRPLTKAEAPALHSEIERIRRQIGAPEIHKILLNQDFNAFASSSPKFAIFGERCYVVLGLPLLLTQRPEEVSATIAHELAHHSRSHVKSGNRAYRLEAMWHTLLYQLSETGSVLTSPMLAFVKWYSPRYSAMTLVLRRQAEYEADALGAEATSKEAMALGLLRMDMDHSCRLTPYMDEIRRSLKTSESPPKKFLGGLMDYAPNDQQAKIEALQIALRRQTVPDDSHPCPRERTEALGISADPEDEASLRALLARIGTVEQSAAEHFLGDLLPRVLEEYDSAWYTDEAEGWTLARKALQEAETKLAAYDGRNDEDLDEDESLDKLKLSLDVHGTEIILPYASRLAERFPQHAQIQYIAG